MLVLFLACFVSGHWHFSSKGIPIWMVFFLNRNVDESWSVLAILLLLLFFFVMINYCFNYCLNGLSLVIGCPLPECFLNLFESDAFLIHFLQCNFSRLYFKIKFFFVNKKIIFLPFFSYSFVQVFRFNLIPSPIFHSSLVRINDELYLSGSNDLAEVELNWIYRMASVLW